MTYELICDSDRAPAITNLQFTSNEVINRGDRVCGLYINEKDFIVDENNQVSVIQLVNYDYYRTDNCVIHRG